MSNLTSGYRSNAGIYLYDVNKGSIDIRNNVISDRYYGIRASQFTRSVWWWVSGLKASGVEQEVYYDQSVANEPNKGPDR